MAAIIAVDDVHKASKELVADGVEFTRSRPSAITERTATCATVR